MKNILLFGLSILMVNGLFAQTEDFEDLQVTDPENGFYGTVPDGWSRFVEGDVSLKDSAAWEPVTENARLTEDEESGICMKMAAFLTGGANYWLVTKQFAPASDNILEFWLRDSDWAPDNDDDLNLDVFISTSPTQPASSDDFEADPIMIVEETDDNTYYDYQLDLSAYAGKNIWVGFRVTNQNAMCDGWWLDDLDGFGELVSTKELVAKSSARVYPNPTTGTLSIGNITNAEVYVYNIAGQEVASFEQVQNKQKLDLNIETGVYILKIKDGVNESVQKINLIK